MISLFSTDRIVSSAPSLNGNYNSFIILSFFPSMLIFSDGRSRAALELENLALRHQIGVLQRLATKCPRLTVRSGISRFSTGTDGGQVKCKWHPCESRWVFVEEVCRALGGEEPYLKNDRYSVDQVRPPAKIWCRAWLCHVGSGGIFPGNGARVSGTAMDWPLDFRFRECTCRINSG